MFICRTNININVGRLQPHIITDNGISEHRALFESSSERGPETSIVCRFSCVISVCSLSSRALLEKPVRRLFKKFPVCIRTPSFIIAFPSGSRCELSQASWIQSIPLMFEMFYNTNFTSESRSRKLFLSVSLSDNNVSHVSHLFYTRQVPHKAYTPF